MARPSSPGYTGPAMERPIGLILSAIVLSLAALFLLLLTAVMALAAIFAGRQPATAAMPHFLTYSMLAISVFYAVLAVWAILTVIGILRFRQWGRYSILIIGGGLAAIGVLAVFGTLLSRAMLPSLQAQQPALDPHIFSIVMILMAAIYLLIAAVGIWWLTYFNLRSTRELFLNPTLLDPQSGDSGSSFSRAPTAIKIIGVFLFFSAVCCLLGAFLPFPTFLLGFILPPAASHVLYLLFAVIFALAGYGLLHLKESARLLTIAFLILGCCNILLAALPWYQNQFRLYMTQFTTAMPTMPGQPLIVFNDTGTIILISCVWGLIFYGITFWFLHRHRAAFQPSQPSPSPMLEA
jgi:hypothetical protein